MNLGVECAVAPGNRISAGTWYAANAFAASSFSTSRGASCGALSNSSHCPLCGRSARNWRTSAVSACTRSSIACPAGWSGFGFGFWSVQ